MTVRGVNTREPQLVLRPLAGFLPEAERELRNRLVRFEHVSTTKLIDTIKIELDNGDGALLSPESVALGVRFEVAWGYVGHLAEPVVAVAQKVVGMSGRRRYGGGRQPVRESLGGDGKVMIECQAKTRQLHRLFPDDNSGTERPGPRRFENMTLSAAIRQIAKRYGFRDEQLLVEPPRHDPLRRLIAIPSDETDAQFLQRQARLLGYVFAVSEGWFRFHSRSFSVNPIPLRFFSGDPDVRNYKIDGDLTLSAPRRVSARGYNPDEGSTVWFTTEAQDDGPLGRPEPGAAERAEVGDRNTPAGAFGIGGLEPASVRSEFDIFTVARASERAINAAYRRLKNHADRKWKLSLELVGNPLVFAKEWFDFSGAGPLTDGRWFARKVTHTFEGGTVYITKIDEATRNKPGGGENEVHFSNGIPNAPGDPGDPATQHGIGTFVTATPPSRTRSSQRTEPTD